MKHFKELKTAINLIVAPCIFCTITSIYQPTNTHIISHKTLLKHFKTLRHVSILPDHHQGALFLGKVMLQYSQFNSYLQTSCFDNILNSIIIYRHAATTLRLQIRIEMYCNITLARNKAPWWWSNNIETCRSVLKCFKSVLCEIICAFVGWYMEVKNSNSDAACLQLPSMWTVNKVNETYKLNYSKQFVITKKPVFPGNNRLLQSFCDYTHIRIWLRPKLRTYWYGFKILCMQQLK